jgi:hypothetical protein
VCEAQGPIFYETWYNHYAGEGPAPNCFPAVQFPAMLQSLRKYGRQMTLLKREVMMSYLCDLHGKNSLLA